MPIMTTNLPAALTNETLLSLPQAAKRLPSYRGDRPVSVSCIMRWILAGVPTAAGRVHLEAVRLGGRWLTSVEAIDRFAAAQTPDQASLPHFPRSLPARRPTTDLADGQ